MPYQSAMPACQRQVVAKTFLPKPLSGLLGVRAPRRRVVPAAFAVEPPRGIEPLSDRLQNGGITLMLERQIADGAHRLAELPARKSGPGGI